MRDRHATLLFFSVNLSLVMEFIPTPEELRALRRRAGLTQAELAKRAGVSQSLIARIEAGTVNPRLSTLAKIYNALREYVEEEVTVDRVMHSPVITVSVDESVERIVKVMWDNGISQVPVVDKSGYVIGTIHERDVVDAFLKYRERALHMRAIDVMSEPLPMISKNSKLSSVVKLLRSEVPAVLVIEEGKPIGIVTRSDLMKFFAGFWRERG
ncbi:MAG: transcriptional regulator [Thermoprotei archaeon]|nr:MAG: transcriptional regulator [Thermoprotei archaeon]